MVRWHFYFPYDPFTCTHFNLRVNASWELVEFRITGWFRVWSNPRKAAWMHQMYIWRQVSPQPRSNCLCRAVFCVNFNWNITVLRFSSQTCWQDRWINKVPRPWPGSSVNCNSQFVKMLMCMNILSVCVCSATKPHHGSLRLVSSGCRWVWGDVFKRKDGIRNVQMWWWFVWGQMLLWPVLTVAAVPRYDDHLRDYMRFTRHWCSQSTPEISVSAFSLWWWQAGWQRHCGHSRQPAPPR